MVIDMSSCSYMKLKENRIQRRSQIELQPCNVNYEKRRFEFLIDLGTEVDKLYLIDNTFQILQTVSVSGCKILPILLKRTLTDCGMIYSIPLAGYNRNRITDVVVEYVDSIERGEPRLIVNQVTSLEKQSPFGDCVIARCMEKCSDTYQYTLQGSIIPIYLYTVTIAIPKHEKSKCTHIRAKFVAESEMTSIMADSKGVIALIASNEYDEMLTRHIDNPNGYDLYTLKIADHGQPTYRNGMRIVIEADIDQELKDGNPVVLLWMGSSIM